MLSPCPWNFCVWEGTWENQRKREEDLISASSSSFQYVDQAFWCAVCPGTDCPHHNSQEAKKDIKSTQWIFSYGLLDYVQFTFILASEHFQEKEIYNHFNVWRGPFKDSKCPPPSTPWVKLIISVGWNEGLDPHIGLCWCRSGWEE